MGIRLVNDGTDYESIAWGEVGHEIYGTNFCADATLGSDRATLGSDRVLQPIMPLDLPVKVRSWELTVYPRSYIRRWLGVTRPAKART